MVAVYLAVDLVALCVVLVDYFPDYCFLAGYFGFLCLDSCNQLFKNFRVGKRVFLMNKILGII